LDKEVHSDWISNANRLSEPSNMLSEESFTLIEGCHVLSSKASDAQLIRGMGSALSCWNKNSGNRGLIQCREHMAYCFLNPEYYTQRTVPSLFLRQSVGDHALL